MRVRRAQHRQSTFRDSVVWGLVLALLIYGYSGLLAGGFGALHHHVEPATENMSLASRLHSAVRAWFETAQTRRPGIFVHSQSPQPHDHGLFERHHHDVGDETVVTLGAQASSGHSADDLPTTGASGLASVPLCPLSTPLVVLSLEQGRSRWPDGAAATWRSIDSRQLERPPQA